MNDKKIKILVVDDKEGPRYDLKRAAEGDNRQIIEASDTDGAIRLINEIDFHIVVTDMWLEENREGGLTVLREAKKKDPITQVIVVTAFGRAEKGPEIYKYNN